MAATFSWADVGTGVSSAISAWGVASANKITAQANAESQRIIREAQNEQRASAVTLAGVMRSISYRSALSNAGVATNNASEFMARTAESYTAANFEQGLKSVEQMGAYAARAAAAGVGGASVRAISQTMQLQQSRQAQATEERQDQTMYELAKARSGIMPAAVSRLDVSPIAANLDYTPTFDPAGNSANLLTYLTQGLMSKSNSLQVALDSIDFGGKDDTQLPTGDFNRLDRATSPITID